MVLPTVTEHQQPPPAGAEPDKRAQLARLLREKASRATSEFSLSSGQQALWFLHRSAPQSPAYNTALAVRIRSEVKADALQRAFETLVARHTSLRTTFPLRDRSPVQLVHGYRDLCFQQIDASAWTEQQLRENVQEDYGQPFVLESDPLMRVSLYRRAPHDQILLLTLHHIICDAWSIWMLMRELSVLYPASLSGRRAELLPVKKQFHEFVAWQNGILAGLEGEQLWQYWSRQLKGALPVLELPTDRPYPPLNDLRGASHFFTIAEPLKGRLVEVAKQQGATLYMILLATFQTLLHRYSGQDDIIVGSPVVGRSQADFSETVGYLTNPLPVRADLSGNPSFRDFLSQVRHVVLDGLTHQDLPFPRLVERLQPARVAGRTPVFQTMFVLQRPPQSEEFRALFAGERQGPICWGGLEMEPFELAQMEGQFDLTWEAVEGKQRLSCVLKYRPDLFDASTIQRMEGHLRTLLEAAVVNLDRRLGDLPNLTATEQRQVTVLWNATRRDYPLDRCLHHWIEDQARATPERVAVEFDKAGRSLTYRELNARANQLARHLQHLGVGPETLVGICTERSLEMVIGLLGILKAGAAYVPLDPDYPPDRLAFMIEDAAGPVLLTQRACLDCVPGTAARMVVLDDIWEQIAGQNDDDLRALVGPENLAYVIYTSGSTGKPKGVANTHRGICNRLLWMQEEYGLDESDRVLQKTAYSFDVSVWEFFWPLMTGARLVLAVPGGHKDPDYLIGAIARHWITTLHFVPSMLPVFLDAAGVDRLSGTLRRVICSGEPLPYPLQQRFFERLHIELHNLYGPTEAAIDVTYWPCQRDAQRQVVPIGWPIANTQIHILDRYLHPVPVGVPGELYIGGVGLARGYWNRPELTAENFIPDPFSDAPDARLYKSGDLCRRLPDSSIEYLQRFDHQVKIRGFRIELGEIENILAAHPKVREVVARVDREADGETRLLVWLVPANGASPSPGELRQFLKQRLPDYMVPAFFVTLDRLPLTPSGKCDRRALPAPEAHCHDSAQEVALPRTEGERKIAEIWRATLRLDKVGVHDNFFDLGGHSILLVRLHTRLLEAFGRSPSVIELFQYPTVAALAAYYSPNGRPERATAPERPAHDTGADLAIIGMSCRFPGAPDVDTFWQNLRQGLESISRFTTEELLACGADPELVKNPNYVGAHGVLEGKELFDAAFFGFTPREAEMMDVQHRLLLECAWTALEQAGHDPQAERRRCGVFAGVGLNTYLLNNLYPRRGLLAAAGGYQAMLANDKDYTATRISYKLNLTGPSVTVQTACSTSLVAVHLACRSVLAGECDLALAGGCSINVPGAGYLYQPDMILSPDGHCRAFDKDAQGTVGGNGVGFVVVKRLADALEDGDTIHAIIKGSAVNNDGSLKAGYTAPSMAGQASVIADALRVAGIPADSIGYIEAHGTGTRLGDPIEIAALNRVFGGRAQAARPCAIGSVKTNVGHLDTAAGVAGLIKTALSLEHAVLPPSLHFREPNPQMELAAGPLRIQADLQPWESVMQPRRAGVSSFGIGGTNAHVVLEEPPPRPPTGPGRPWQLLILSARNENALDEAAANLAGYLAAHPAADLADVAFTLACGRRAFDRRRMLVCHSAEDAVRALRGEAHADNGPTRAAVPRILDASAGSAESPVAFLFSGQGSQYVNMAEELYREEPVFRGQVDRCSELLRPHLKLDLRAVLYPGTRRSDSAAERLNQTALAQPALFVVEYALVELWGSWGVRPEAMIGHSIGEYVAACLAGVMSLEDALTLVARRGEIMQQMPAGSMLAVPLAEDEVQSLLGADLSLAAVNGPNLCVMSGPDAAVLRLAEHLAAQGVAARRLHTSHAFHSAMMEPAVASFRECVERVRLDRPSLPFVSNVTGTWIEHGQATDPGYWALHLRQTVRFHAGLQTLLEEPQRLLIEVGPGTVLGNLAIRHPQRSATQTVVISTRHPNETKSDVAHMLAAAGQLWLAGAPCDWPGFYAGQRRQRLPLPTYPFQRQRYWIDAPGSPGQPEEARTPKQESSANIDDWFFIPSWQRSVPPAGIPEPGSRWLLLLDSCGLGEALEQRLQRQGACVTLVRPGPQFCRQAEGEYELNPAQRSDYDLLVRNLGEAKRTPQTIVHLWNCTPKGHQPHGSAATLAARDASFFSLVYLARSLGEQTLRETCRLVVVSNNLHNVTGAERLEPIKALLLGPATVISQEYAELRCTSIDVDLPAEGSLRDRLVERLITEPAAADGERVIAYRGGHRWVQRFVPARLEPQRPRVRDHGVYLITGGTGGVGLELAEWLARNAAGAKLVLTARSELPPRTKWQGYLQPDEASAASRSPGRTDFAPVLARSSADMELAEWTDHFTRLEADLQATAEKAPQTDLAEREQALDRLCALYIYRYLRESGIDLQTGAGYSRDELVRRLRILPKFEKFLAFFIRTLVEEGILSEANGRVSVRKAPAEVDNDEAFRAAVRAKFPSLTAIDDLLRHCADRYGAALSGDIEAIGGLYPEGKLDLLGVADEFTQQHGQRRLYIEMLAEIVRQAAAASPGRKLRIVEVGGGGGALTLAVLQRLHGSSVEFCFTDVGESVVLEAEKKAKKLGFDGLQFAVLDISRDPVAQEFEAGSYDIVLGLDVVHATPRIETTLRNLKKLLAPRGLLGLVETVRPHRHVDMIWGLTEGWWYFEDNELRQNSPLLSIQQWEAILRQAGFADVESWPRGKERRCAAEFGLMLAQNAADDRTAAPAGRIPTVVADDSGRLRDKIERLSRLEELGAEVLVMRADVSDPVQMRSVVNHVLDRFGQIHGVVHTAGIAGGGTIQIKTREEAEREFTARVDGTLVLEEVLSGQPLDFLVLCSSEASATGGLGQVAYCASCAFLDAFAEARNSPDGGTQVVAIDWDRWRGLGMAVAIESLYRELTGEELTGGLPPADGGIVFGRILDSQCSPRVVVSTRHFPTMVRQSQTYQLGQFEQRLPELQLHARPELATNYIAPANDTEKRIARIWEEELGIDRVGTHDEYVALGGDSLMAIKLVARLRDEIQVHLNVRALYEHRTVAALAKHVAAVQWAAEGDSPTDSPEHQPEQQEEGVL